jgi:hypothetical protein
VSSRSKHTPSSARAPSGGSRESDFTWAVYLLRPDAEMAERTSGREGEKV